MAIMIYTWYHRLSVFHDHPFVMYYIKLKLSLSDHVRFFAGKYDDVYEK